jgi:thymidylate synthase ThyX
MTLAQIKKIRPLNEEKLRQLGWIRIAKNCWSHSSSRYIIKFDCFLLYNSSWTKAKQSLKKADFVLFPAHQRGRATVQLKVNTSRISDKLVNLILDKIQEYEEKTGQELDLDVHKGNMGLLKGNPVLFDI